jgi:AtzE family amidohydrolase
MIDPFAPAHVTAGHVRSGELAVIEVVEASLAHIEALNPALAAFTDVTAERARAAAREIDRKRKAGESLGPLAGVPFAAKNLFDIAGLPTRAGSKINRENAPASRDAALIERLTAAGGVLVGGLNMGEYAYDFTGENAHDGNCRNPHDLSRMSGGSSSGSGAATAAGMAPVSLGSDTNGSIRVPSSFCGLFGLKPTYGRLPRTRTFPFCDSLDHLGPLARNVRDLALAYDALQGHDAHDPVCAPRAVALTAPEIARGVEGLRIAIAGGYFDTGGMPEASAAVASAARALGARDIVDLHGALEARAAAFLITNAESSALHLDRLRTRAMDFDPDTRDRFLAGAFVPAVWQVRAQRVRRWFHDEMLKVFETFDVIIAPATPCSAPKTGERVLHFRGSDLPLRANIGVFTQPISCIGLPVVAAPTFGGELPIGVQLIAAPWREDLCLRAAHALEESGVSRVRAPTGLRS